MRHRLSRSSFVFSTSDAVSPGSGKWGRVLHSHIAILHGQRRFTRPTCVHRDHAQSSVISGLPLVLDRGTLSESRGTESMCRMRRAIEILLFRLDRIVWGARPVIGRRGGRGADCYLPARSPSDIDRFTAAHDLPPSASFSAPKNSSTYSSEYASGFFGPAALPLAAPPSPRYKQSCRTGS